MFTFDTNLNRNKTIKPTNKMLEFIKIVEN